MSRKLTTSKRGDLETLKKWDRVEKSHPWGGMDSWRGNDNMFGESADGI